LKIPKIPEMAVGRMWPVATRNASFMAYMPDSWSANPSKTDRTFFFQIWVYLEQGLVEAVIEDVRK